MPSATQHDPPTSLSSDPLTADLAAASQLRNLEQLRRGLEHELRSPLNAVVLNVELLKELTRSGGGETAVVQLERLDLVSKAVERLEAGLEQLLGQVERPDPAAEIFDLGEVIADLQALIGGELRQRGLALEIETAAEELPVSGRRDAVRLALTNVVMNALDASPRERRVGLSVHRHDGQVLIEVRDAGSGIDADIRHQIFDRHFSTKPGAPGIGLGVAKRLIEEDGGRLELTSSGPDGTVFTVSFPEAST